METDPMGQLCLLNEAPVLARSHCVLGEGGRGNLLPADIATVYSDLSSIWIGTAEDLITSTTFVCIAIVEEAAAPG